MSTTNFQDELEEKMEGINDLFEFKPKINNSGSKKHFRRSQRVQSPTGTNLQRFVLGLTWFYLCYFV